MFKVKSRKADKLFSRYIRGLYNWTCQRCGTQYEPNSQGLHCSHYWSRSHESTRFDPDNCLPLCFGCHQLWGHGDLKKQYENHLRNKLSDKGYANLERKAHTYKKKDDKVIIEWLKIIGIK
jgi:hypothetical protein